MAVEPGTRFGVYEVRELLGRGGMGEVYRAIDTRLQREVALKVLPTLFASDTERLARFQREARVLASLNHPSIGAIHGLERVDGVDALVLELVEGPTLADRIAAGPIAMDEALPIAQQIAEALEAAHEHGIVHRDLKPANIKLRPDGAVKVLDFGLAKPEDATSGGSRRGAESVNSPTITSPAIATGAGVILGTAAYMAPEQAKGKRADMRSDAWAFGCVLYEMLTGARAFPGDDVSDTLASVLRAEPDWSALPPETPHAIRQLLRRALEKDRRRRLPHLGSARIEIEEALASPVPRGALSPPHPSVQSRWKRAAAILASWMLVGTLAAAAAWLWKPAPSGSIARFPIIIPDRQAFSPAGGRQMLAVSPDGQRVVYVANNRLYLRDMAQLEPQVIPGSERIEGNVSHPVFSPDGQSIAFYTFVTGAGGTLNRIDVTGGTVVRLCRVRTTNAGLSWSSQGIVIGQGRGGIMRISPDGGTPEQIITVHAGEDAAFPELLQGGRVVMYTLTTGDDVERWDTARVVAQRIADGHRVTLLDDAADARLLATGHLVFTHAGTVFATRFDEQQLTLGGPRVPVLEGVRRGVTGVTHYSVSNTGVLAFNPGPADLSLGGPRELVTIDRRGRVEALKLPARSYVAPRISPDGKHVAFGIEDRSEAAVWIYELSATKPMRKLTFGGNNRYPIWSSNGERVAFQSDREGDAGIFWQRADGSDTAARLTKANAGESHIPESWLPDGSAFSFSVTSSAHTVLWTHSLRDRKSAPVSETRSLSPFNSEFSPDGRWLAYTLRLPDSLTASVMVEPFPPSGAKFLISPDTAHHPVWSRDGKELSFRLSANQQVVVPVTTKPRFAFGQPQILGGQYPPTPFGRPRNYDLMAAGDRFVVAVAESEASVRSPSADTPATREIRVVLNWFEELKARVPLTKR